MKKGQENLSESTTTLDKSEIIYSNNKESKKLIHLPYYKLEELKNKESKKVKPLPKVKKREDHNMPKLQKTSELKSKKKKVILRKNTSDSINLDLNSELEKKNLRKISVFSNDNNIVEAIFSEENLLNKNSKKAQDPDIKNLNAIKNVEEISSNLNPIKSPNKTINFKKENTANSNRVTQESDILVNINVDSIKDSVGDSKKFQNNNIIQNDNNKNKILSSSTTPNTIIPNNNSNNSLNASNFNLSSLGKPLNKGDRLKNLKYAEDEINIKKTRLSRKQKKLQEAENTLASFLSKEDKFNLFNNDDGLNKLNRNISNNTKSNNNNNVNSNYSSSNNFNRQNSFNNNTTINNSNNSNNNDGSILNQTNAQQNKKNDYSVLGRKKKRVSLCKKAVYKYRFKKKQFLISNIFNFEQRGFNENKKSLLETIKEIDNENAENMLSENNQNLPLCEETINKIDLNNVNSDQIKQNKEISLKLELEKKAIKMMLNPNSVKLVGNQSQKEINLENMTKNDDNGLNIISQLINNTESKISVKNSIDKEHSKSTNDKNNVEKQNASIINNNVFNYYNFNAEKNHKKEENLNNRDWNKKKQNFKPKNNSYKYHNFIQPFGYPQPFFFNGFNPFMNRNFNNSFNQSAFPLINHQKEMLNMNSFYNNNFSVSAPELNTKFNKFNDECSLQNNLGNNPFLSENKYYNNPINFNPYSYYNSSNSFASWNTYKSNENHNFNSSNKIQDYPIISSNSDKNYDNNSNRFIFEDSNYNTNNKYNNNKPNNDFKEENQNIKNKKKKNKSKNKNKQKPIESKEKQQESSLNQLINLNNSSKKSSGFLFETALNKPTENKEKIDEEYKQFLESSYKLETDLTNLNGKEFNDYLKENRELKRLNYKNIQKFSNSEVVDEFIDKFEGILPGTNIRQKFIREYVDQILDKDFDKKFSDFIVKLREIYYKKKQIKPAKAKKRFVAGFREVHKKIKLGDAKLVFLIPNIEKIEGKNGLDEKLLEIFKSCKDKNIPIFFGLNKFKLGQISRKKHSCISILCIINVEGFEHELESLIESGMQLKNKFYEKFSEKKNLFADNKFVDIEKFR